MPNHALTQVDVTVQDYFFDGSPDGLPAADFQALSQRASPVSLDTWESWFQAWLAYLAPGLSPAHRYELSLRLTDDAEIQELNADYRHKDQPTDVLAFAALEVDYPQTEEMQALPLYLGDIVISVETAQAQAAQQQHSLKQELAWLAAHALLHLLGWDHPDDSSLERMLLQQDDLLQIVGLRTGYYQVGNATEGHTLATEAGPVYYRGIS